MHNIYELREEIEALQAMLDDAEDDNAEQAIADTLLGMSGEVGDVVESVVKYIKNLEGLADSVAAEVERLKGRIAQQNRRAAAAKDAIKALMDAAGYKKVSTALFSVTLADGRESVQVLDESAVPDDYVVVKTVISPDKKAIAAAFKAGEKIPGCEMVRGQKSLRIK